MRKFDYRPSNQSVNWCVSMIYKSDLEGKFQTIQLLFQFLKIIFRFNRFRRSCRLMFELRTLLRPLLKCTQPEVVRCRKCVHCATCNGKRLPVGQAAANCCRFEDEEHTFLLSAWPSLVECVNFQMNFVVLFLIWCRCNEQECLPRRTEQRETSNSK